ncbi:hypothetical protein ACN38_g5382 [Penicillium nordicum]|uniref:Uncharacterized protein n=1 Tax=Penicillium nordicum TaxID=229535 RepID=A0A0M9WG80_9EURO|nr:hypothetical protein ACN38_g5382 [Penicillium nordicum]
MHVCYIDYGVDLKITQRHIKRHEASSLSMIILSNTFPSFIFSISSNSPPVSHILAQWGHDSKMTPKTQRLMSPPGFF